MNISKKAIKILDILRREFVGAETALDFSNPLELLIATILSAQCTDVRVNKVTPTLFSRFKTAKDYADADQEELEELIRSTGFYRNKAKAIKGCCGKIVSSFASEVPNNIEDLTSLPGVGRKTANIVLSIAFGQDAVAVDTHVKRLSIRIGFTKNSNPDRIEIDLQNTIPQKYWTETTKLLIFHGRHICVARKPKCEVCLISGYCDYFANDKVMASGDVIIAKAGTPLVKLVPVQQDISPRTPGRWKGRISIAKDFDQTPEEVRKAFEGEGESE